MLFNNAGVPMGGAFEAASFDEIDRTLAINFTGVLNGARIGHAYLARTPGSCLLNTASASAIYGSAGLATYSATKFAVRALTANGMRKGSRFARSYPVSSIRRCSTARPLDRTARSARPSWGRGWS